MIYETLEVQDTLVVQFSLISGLVLMTVTLLQMFSVTVVHSGLISVL